MILKGFKLKSKGLMMFILSLLMVLAVACGSESQEEGVVDEQGSVEVEEVDVERVVTAYRPATDFIIALGATDMLVGAQDRAKDDEVLSKIMGDSIEELSEIGSRRNGINVEEVISLEPDLVILYPTDEGDETVKKLEEQGIKVISIEPETIDSLKKELVVVAEAIGKGEVADEIISYYDEKISYVTEKTSSLEKKDVYIAGSRGILSTVSSDMIQSEIVEIAGGVNVASELVGGTNEVNIEQLISWNPEFILSLMYSDEGTPDEIKADSRVSDIMAVQEDNIYQIPSNINAWDMPQPTAILSIMWTAKLLHPEAFEDLDMLEEANSFYESFYGKSFEELGGTL